MGEGRGELFGAKVGQTARPTVRPSPAISPSPGGCDYTHVTTTTTVRHVTASAHSRSNNSRWRGREEGGEEIRHPSIARFDEREEDDRQHRM